MNGGRDITKVGLVVARVPASAVTAADAMLTNPDAISLLTRFG